ncbi:hypothetical protein NW754_001351 [Fusarium falciforme]|nr:hypothetical protein NW754_001351 [Fusarium falciforme]
MPRSTENTNWPLNVSLPVRELIDKFFLLLRTSEPGKGTSLQKEVFTPDARAEVASKWFEGTDDLRTCREHAWVDTEGRHDTVFTVYVNDKQGSDLLLLCETYLKLRNGNEVTTDFVAGVQIDGPETAAPRLRTYWTLWDSAPLRTALQGS